MDAGGQPSDAPQRACDLSKPFGAPVTLQSLGGAGRLWLSPDEMTGYVSAYRADSGYNTGAIWATVRSAITDSFGPLAPLSAVDDPTTYAENPSLTPDALTIVFDSDRGSAASHLYLATRASTAAQFSTPTALTTINSTTSDHSPNVSPDGKTLYFASNRTLVGGNPQGDLFVATLTPAGWLVNGTSPVDGLNGAQSNEDEPVVSTDGLTIYFASNRAGFFRVYVATRATTADAFGAAAEVTPLTPAGGGDVGPSFVSQDGCRLYGSMSFGGALSVWMATKPM
jgi:Tol biopolymer transport system component